jgi:phosphatidylserine/phosphatidylglycerophosphate/cardiolipin synthase-like enzyme
VSLTQLLKLLNFKANHRKVAVARMRDGSLRALIASANPHSASSAHGNVGIQLNDGPLAAVLASEYNIARASILSNQTLCCGPLSGPELVREIERRLKPLSPSATGAEPPAVPPPNAAASRLQYLTESAIAGKIERMLGDAKEGDRVEMMMFYLSDPGVIDGLRTAAMRGASVRLLLDPNKDAFGRLKRGIPNRPVAAGLQSWAAASAMTDLEIRWFATHGEQAHYKLLRVFNWASGKDQLLLGSANFTIRNLRGYNLESAVYIENAGGIGKQAGAVFGNLWENRGNLIYSVPFENYQVSGASYWWGRIKTRLANWTGMCTY